MRIATHLGPPADLDSTWLALGLFEKSSGDPTALGGTRAGAILARLFDSKDLGTSVGDVTPVLGETGLRAKALVGFGLGERDRFGPGPAYLAGVALAKRLAAKPRERVSVVVPEAEDASAAASALVEGLIVGTRGPDLRKAEPARHPFGELVLVAPPGTTITAAGLEAAVRRGQIVGEAINLARDLANTPPSEKPPVQLAERVLELTEAVGIEAEMWDRERLLSERFGGMLGVSAGSEEPPAFVRLGYRRGGDRPTLALVGKGVTFDSGGLSLKPSASMEDMKSDMTGAAVVVAAMCAIARLGLPVNLAGFLAFTENMTGGRAMKLGDVLTIRNGKTVEVLNTDAEGRLILADALSYAVEQAPARVLDLATLTGACMVALGTKVAGMFSNDDPFADAVLAASRRTGERAWRLPLDEDYDELLKSSIADLKNVGGKWAGAVTAAKFLQRFVGTTPWVHLDIAGPSWADTDTSTRDVGATGCFVRTLVALAEHDR
jgi:leucyl aminopeptidase